MEHKNAEPVANDIATLVAKSFTDVTIVNNVHTIDSAAEHVIDMNILYDDGIVYNVSVYVTAIGRPE